MTQKHWRVSADVPSATRAQLLRMFPPRFEQVFCRSLTWAYRVTDEFEFSGQAVDATVYGIHQTDSHEALLVGLGGDLMRPDGKRLFLTLSTAKGVEPVEAGNILDRHIRRFDDKVIFQTRLTRQPLWKMQPQTAPAMAAA